MPNYLTPQYIETKRREMTSEGIDPRDADRHIADFISKNDPSFTADYDYMKAKNPDGFSSLLDFRAYGTTSPQDRFQIPDAKEPGVFSRLGQSIMSTPERLQRGFGNMETRTGRTEASKGFDLADLPGDIADIIGPALPIIGGIIGGTAGTVISAPTVAGIPLGAVAGAGAGGAALEGGRRAIGDLLNVDQRFSGKPADFSPTGEVVKGIAVEGAMNTIGEVGGQLIVRGLTKLAAPFAKQFMRDTAEIAARQGVKLPVSAMTKSPVVQGSEALASKGFFGGQVGEVSEQASKRIAEIGDEFVSSIGGSEDLLIAGKSIDEGAKAYRSAWQTAKSKLYNIASELIQARPKREYIDVSEPIAVLEKILKSKAAAGEVLEGSVDASRLQTILKNLKGKKLSIGILESTSNELNQIINHGGLVKTGDEAALSSVQSAIQNSLESHVAKFAPDVAEALAKADATYKKGIELLDSGMGGQIDALSETPERIVDAIIKPNSESNVARLLDLVGRGKNGSTRVANVKTAFAKRLIDSAKNQDGTFAGDKLGTALKKYGKTIEAVFGKDAAAQLDEIAKLSHAMTAGSKMAQGSQTAFISKVSSTIIGASTAVMAGRPDLAVGIIIGASGSDYALMKLFSTDAGRKLLLEGYQMQLGRGIPNAAQGVVQGAQQMMQPSPQQQ